MLAQQVTGEPLSQVAALLFYLFAGLTVLSAWAIVFSQNIVRMSFYLLLTLGGAAGLYFMLATEFLAAIQLIVYAGGTLILIVFGIMLTSRNPFLQLKPAAWEVAVAMLVAGSIMGLSLLALVHSAVPHNPDALPASGSAGPDGYSLVERIGQALLSTHLVPFEVAAVLLLIVMIGAAYMARRRHRSGEQ